MITELRRNLHKQSYKIIIWLTIFSLGGAFAPQVFKALKRGSGIAQVNGQDISMGAFQNRLEEERERINGIVRRFGKDAESIMKSFGMSTDPARLAREGLIQEILIRQSADQANLILEQSYI